MNRTAIGDFPPVIERSSPFFDAFISYGRADSKAFAITLYRRLTEIGLSVWFDQEDIPLAVDFQEQINNGIEKTHNFLFIIAPHSVNSPYCLKEIELAIKLNKRIIPLLHVEQISRDTWQSRNPTGTDEDWIQYQAEGRHNSFVNIHPVISKINWIYFREGLDDFEASFEGLISSLRKHRDYVEQHTEYLGRALEWSRNQKRDIYLLLEEPRHRAEAWLKYRFIDEQPPCLPTALHGEYICESTKQAEGFTSQVCFCYVHSLLDQTHETIQYVRRSLMANGITVTDNKVESQSSKEFDARRRRKVDYADNFIYFITEESLLNDYCQSQFQYAFKGNKRIIFLIIQATNSNLYPSLIEEISILDFTDLEQPEKRQASMDALLNLLGRDAYYHKRHKYLAVRALRWWEQRRIPSLLLRGHLLQVYEDLSKIADQRKQQPFTHIQKEYLQASVEQSTNIQLDVFLIYAPEDLDFTNKFNEALEYQEKTTFFAQDHLNPEDESKDSRDQALVNSANVIFILSPDAVGSSACLAQLDRAKRLQKRIFGILYRPVKLEQLEKICPNDEQWLDFSDLSSDFYAEFSQLLRLLETDKGYLQDHTKWLQRTMEWANKNKTRDLLLRGNELAIAQYWLKEADEKKQQPIPTQLQREYIQSSVAEANRAKLISKILFVAMGVGFVFTSTSGVIASRESYKAGVSELDAISNTSDALFTSNNHLDAFVEAMRAWRKSEHIHLRGKDRAIEKEIEQVLSQSVYQLKEKNRLSRHSAAVFGVDYSADGNLLVSAGADHAVHLWSAAGEHLQTLGEVGPIEKGHTSSVYAAEFSPDDQWIASGGADKSIKLWKRDNQGQYQFFKTIQGCILEQSRDCLGHTEAINALAFSPDGSTIASAGQDGMMKLWDREGNYQTTLQSTQPQEGEGVESINDVAFMPDGDRLVGVTNNRNVHIWQRQGDGTFALVQTFAGCRSDETCDGHQDEVKAVAISQDGQLIVTASEDKTVKIWQSDGTLLHTLIGHTDEVEGVAIDSTSSQGKMIASVSRDKTIKLWSLDGSLIQSLSGHTSRIYDVDFKPGEAAIASASRDKTIKLWSLNNEIVTPLYGHSSRVYSVVFSPDDQLIASAGRDRTVRLWDRQGNLLKTFTGHTAEVERVVFSPDGKLLASASWDNTVKIWSTEGDQGLVRTITGHTDEVYGVSFTPDGERIATLSIDGTLRLWTLEGQEVQRSELTESQVYDLEFSEDGSILALAIGNNVQIWQRKNQDLYVLTQKIGGCQILDDTCDAHSADIEEVAIDFEHQAIATGSRDSTVKLWDLNTGQLLYTLKGHDSEVEGVTISANHQRIVSASRDGTLVVWQNLPDLDAVREYLKKHQRSLTYWINPPKDYEAPEGLNGEVKSTVLKGHQAEVYAADFSADSQMLVSASADQTVILWDLEVALNLEKLIAYGCKWTQNYLQYSQLAPLPETEDAICPGLDEQNIPDPNF